MDRRAASLGGRGSLRDPLLAAATFEHLEHDQSASRPGAAPLGPHDTRGPRGIRGAQAEPLGRLFLRAETAPAPAPLRQRLAGECLGLGVLPEAAAVVPARGDLVGDQRETGADPRAPARDARLGLRARPNHRTAQAARALQLRASAEAPEAGPLHFCVLAGSAVLPRSSPGTARPSPHGPKALRPRSAMGT